MTYSIILNRSHELKRIVKTMDSEISDAHHIALKVVVELTDKSFRCWNTQKVYSKWLENGSTLCLKKLMSAERIDIDNNLMKFRAFCILDTAIIKLLESWKD